MQNFLVIDLEATCDQNGHIRRSDMEIIEIGGAIVNLDTFEITQRYQGYIKPVANPTLTSFCKELTGITQTKVNTAPYFYDALNTFKSWLSAHKSLAVWGSWGAYDKNQFEQDCVRHQQTNPFDSLQHINLKTSYAEALKTRSKGMANAYKEIGEDLIGRHHSGVDDAINIARLLSLAPKFGDLIRQKTLSYL